LRAHWLTFIVNKRTYRRMNL